MLDKINLKKIMLKEEYKQEVPPLKQKMGELQQRFKQAKVPVIVLFEGWGASGKGSLMSNVILTMDPRGFHVESTTPPTLEERRHPYLWRFWKKLPARGTMGVFDRGWYQELAFPSHALHLEQKELRERLESVKIFERQLHDDGYLILKFFLHIGQREQKKRFDKLLSSKDTAWRVSLNDLEQNRRYDEYYQIIDGILEETNTDYAPWHVIGSEDKYSALAEIYHILVDGIGAAVEASREGKRSAPKKAVPIVVSDHFKLVKEPKLSEVNLTKALNEEEYRELLKKEQSTLKKLHNKIYRKRSLWSSPMRAGTPPERAAISAGSLRPWTQEATRWCPSRPPPPTSWPTSICGGSGLSCPRMGISPSSTAPGMGGLWWSASRASPPRSNGSGPIRRSMSSRRSWNAGAR